MGYGALFIVIVFYTTRPVASMQKFVEHSASGFSTTVRHVHSNYFV